jgi:c-di-GMP-binding flagellar brake protein YcgR
LTHERRRNPRIDVNVPISYDCYDDDGEIFEQKLGVALDISIGGILIETHDIIDANYVRVIFVNKDSKRLSIIGSVVHSKRKENGKVKSGVCFHGNDKENIQFATNIIRAYYHSRKLISRTSAAME